MLGVISFPVARAWYTSQAKQKFFLATLSKNTRSSADNGMMNLLCVVGKRSQKEASLSLQ
jgi:hypothetical protein